MSEHTPSSLRRRHLLAAPLALAAPWPAPAGAAAAGADGGRKVLRLAFRSAETSFDPARISDVYSSVVTAHIFEAPYGYDHLARPFKVVPVLADGMPEVSSDFRVWTVRLKRGIYFADDPAFKGQRRELQADDLAYAVKRVVDPANKSPRASAVLEDGIVGLAELRKAALDARKPFDYDAPVAGLQVLDRYTLRYTLAEPRPRFVTGTLTVGQALGAQAREVVEFYGDAINAHPVGTGPFKLKSWKRSSKIVLERNPQFREVFYDAQPTADDAEGQAILAKFKGRRLPLVDEVQVAIIEESQPLWLSFANAEIDGLVTQAGQLPPEYVAIATPNGKLAPNLAKRGIWMKRSVMADVTVEYFNMEDPVVGGYTPEKVALRRAVQLAYDINREIRLIRRGVGIPAQSPAMPYTTGYDPTFKSEASDYDPARARALLDMYGYVDRDGDGWRELPDGKPLTLVFATQPDQIYRQYNDLKRRGLADVGIRCEFDTQQWAAQMKRAQAGSLQIWSLGQSAGDPDGQSALQALYSPQAGQENLARFKLPAMDTIFTKAAALPDGPEREKLFLEAKRINAAYMPYRYLTHRLGVELTHPWMQGHRRPVFWYNWWHMVDIDPARGGNAA